MKIIQLILLITLSFNVKSQDILSLKERARVIEEIQKDRFDNLLPKLMEETGIDMWVIITREYNEDPVIKTLLPPTWLNARRRTILAFHYDKKSKDLEKVAIARYSFGKNIPSIWNKEEEPNQMKALAKFIEEKNPEKIGLNFSDHFALADGIVKTDYELFLDNLPSKLSKRIVSAEELAIRWIETRTEKEMIIYDQLVEITHGIINEAFSTNVITPGVTTTDDVVWWMREKVKKLGLKTWFHPTIDVQRNENSDLYAFDGESKFDIILPGDLIHCDFGITYLTLNTDCQELAYVLKPDETEAPDYLVKALDEGNRVQDIFTDLFEHKKTGNQILKEALEQGRNEGYRPQIYTHPLGTFGHSAGTTLGMWDSQGGVPFTGDFPMNYNTVYAIELNTKVFIKEWNKDIRVMLEEAGVFEETGFRYVNGRQTELILVGSKRNHLGN
ncbi:MAG: M24 family metallopeptidase [Bacteroidota bacterium]|nr:M24 family metallopeptidase [Bacteroidota bacterium]